VFSGEAWGGGEDGEGKDRKKNAKGTTGAQNREEINSRLRTTAKDGEGKKERKRGSEVKKTGRGR